MYWGRLKVFNQLILVLSLDIAWIDAAVLSFQYIQSCLSVFDSNITLSVTQDFLMTTARVNEPTPAVMFYGTRPSSSFHTSTTDNSSNATPTATLDHWIGENRPQWFCFRMLVISCWVAYLCDYLCTDVILANWRSRIKNKRTTS